MRTLGVFILILAAGAGAARAQVVDPEYQRVEKAMKADIGRDCAGLNPIKRDICVRQVRAKYEEVGRLRGTIEYVRKNYGDLSVQELDQEIRKRNALYGKLRGSFTRDRAPGELTDDAMEIEVSALRALINEKGGMPGSRRR